VEFDTEGKISLAIPEDGINSNGWTIIPLSPPEVEYRIQSIAIDSLPPDNTLISCMVFMYLGKHYGEPHLIVPNLIMLGGPLPIVDSML